MLYSCILQNCINRTLPYVISQEIEMYNIRHGKRKICSHLGDSMCMEYTCWKMEFVTLIYWSCHCNNQSKKELRIFFNRQWYPHCYHSIVMQSQENSVCLICLCTLHWRHNGRDSVSNHQPHNCLLNRLFRRRSKKTSQLPVTGLCEWGIHRWPVNSPHKWPVTRKMFPFDDVIMYTWVLTKCFLFSYNLL